MENLTYGHENATPEEVRRAAELARIHDEIMAMPDGYRGWIAEGGRNLSGGQRQRITLARVFLANPPILLLDEATSALDNINEKAIRDALAATRGDRTTILVAHRLTTLNDADEILVFDKGLIVERGARFRIWSKPAACSPAWCIAPSKPRRPTPDGRPFPSNVRAALGVERALFHQAQGVLDRGRRQTPAGMAQERRRRTRQKALRRAATHLGDALGRDAPAPAGQFLQRFANPNQTKHAWTYW